MLTQEQALEAMSCGFIIEVLAADGECEGVIDPFHVGWDQAQVEFTWHLGQGHTLTKAGLSDGWDDVAAPEDFIVPEGYDEAPKRNPNPPESTPIPAYLRGQLTQEEWDDIPF